MLELAIVLVIIGLIVGGILVGQDLIKSAEIRATIAQIEKYNSSVNTFRSKFSSIPGDIPQNSAGQFGLFQLTNAAATGEGDGNGIIEGGSGGSNVGIGETLVFWRHLSEASLIDGGFGISGNSAIVAATGQLTGDVTNVSASLPASKTTPSQYFIVYSSGSTNYYQLLPVTQITAATGAYSLNTTGLSPTQAYNMDVKLDDGMPNTGTVVARSISAINTAPSVAGASASNTCTIGTGITSDKYNLVIASGGTDPSCSVRFRFN